MYVYSLCRGTVSDMIVTAIHIWSTFIYFDWPTALYEISCLESSKLSEGEIEKMIVEGARQNLPTLKQVVKTYNKIQFFNPFLTMNDDLTYGADCTISFFLMFHFTMNPPLPLLTSNNPASSSDLFHSFSLNYWFTSCHHLLC